MNEQHFISSINLLMEKIEGIKIELDRTKLLMWMLIAFGIHAGKGDIMKGHIIVYEDKNILQIFTNENEKVDEYELEEITIENYHPMSGNTKIIEDILKKTCNNMEVCMKKEEKKQIEKIDTPENRAKLLTILTGHVGETNAISMGELYERVFNKQWRNKINDTRKIRLLVNKLRSEGIAICSTTDQNYGGYYLAAAGSEAQDYLRRLERRALRILWRISKIKKISLPELLGQMRLHMVEKGTPDAA